MFIFLQKAIDTLNPKELRQLLNYRSTDKSSLSSLRARSYELLKTNYLSTKSRLQNVLEKQKYVSVFHHLNDQYNTETKSIDFEVRSKLFFFFSILLHANV